MSLASSAGAEVERTVAPPSGRQWTIRSGQHEATVVEVGGGLRTYRLADVDVVDGYAEDEMCPGFAGAILAPWPNRIRDGRYTFAGQAHQLWITEPATHNALHGLVAWARWTATSVEDDQVTLEHDMPPQPGYPWPLHLRSTWSVGADGLRGEHVVTNQGGRPCPFGFSVHPYLYVPGVPIEDMLLQVPGRSRLLLDGRLLPIGAARVFGGEMDYTEPRRIGGAVLDVAFGDIIRDADGGSAVSLTTADGRGARVWADDKFSWWQVYTSDTLRAERRRRSVAIEPMTCPPDAFRSGRDVIVLEPGESWTGVWGITPLP